MIFFSASNGVVLATENKHKWILYEEHSVNKVEMITNHIGMVYSGKCHIKYPVFKSLFFVFLNFSVNFLICLRYGT